MNSALCRDALLALLLVGCASAPTQRPPIAYVPIDHVPDETVIATDPAPIATRNDLGIHSGFDIPPPTARRRRVFFFRPR